MVWICYSVRFVLLRYSMVRVLSVMMLVVWLCSSLFIWFLLCVLEFGLVGVCVCLW